MCSCWRFGLNKDTHQKEAHGSLRVRATPLRKKRVVMPHSKYGNIAASMRERIIVCRLSAHGENVAGAAQDHEEATCSGHNHGRRNDFSCP